MQPVFLRRLKQQYNLLEGERLELSVETEGEPDVHWYYEGRKLKSGFNEFMSISSNKNIHLLVIEETVIDDEGFYECLAKYKDFEITTSTDVLIKEIVSFNDNTPELHIDMASSSEDSANLSDGSKEDVN